MHRLNIVLIALWLISPAGFPATQGIDTSMIIAPLDTSWNTAGGEVGRQPGNDELRQRYNQKIRKADHEFNITGNLSLARSLYEEASRMEPEKNYPRDQVVEIDKQLLQTERQSFFSGFPPTVYLVAGVAILSVFLLVSVLVIRHRRIRGRSGTRPAEAEKPEAPPGYRPEELDNVGNKFAMSAALQNNPLLSARIGLDLNSHDELVRMEAELAMMSLNQMDPLSFLVLLRQEFTPDEQSMIYGMIRSNQIPKPDFSRWLNSPNQSVALFCRQMMREFAGEES